MNNTNENITFFLALKATVTGIATGFSVAFGWMGWLIVMWMACMALDYLTGSIAAGRNKEWKSQLAREGIFTKGGMIVVVIIAAIADTVFGMILVNVPGFNIPYTFALLPIVLVWYIVTELGSMVENAAAMGAPVPSVLTKVLAAVTGAAGDNGNT